LLKIIRKKKRERQPSKKCGHLQAPESTAKLGKKKRRKKRKVKEAIGAEDIEIKAIDSC
jgi:hypothetical protein